jgi:prepilin peptidase CpaA
MMFVAIIVATVAAVADFRTGKIPNWLTLGALGLAFVVGAFEDSVSSALEGAAVCSLVPLYLFARRLPVCGGGDVKLLVAMGALCHPARGIIIQMCSLLMGWILLQSVTRVRFAPVVWLATLGVALC